MTSAMPTRRFDKRAIKNSFHTIKWPCQGRITEIIGTIVEAHLPNAQLGTIVQFENKTGGKASLGEVVGFKQSRVLILPYGHLAGIAPGDQVLPYKAFTHLPVCDQLLGHIFDPFLNLLDDGEFSPSTQSLHYNIDNEAPNPLERKRIDTPLSLGVRAIDGLLTFGQGQRIGIMAGSGVGKSVLMGMIAKHSDADVNVIALIGERGREVREFVEKELGEEGLKRSVVIAVTSDQSPLARIRGAKVATTIAEYFSDQGKNVMLMLDSLTRVAMAQREIGNAIGEPPTTKGYTPSVFSLLPKLLERAGPQRSGKGSISGLYTVLVDGDDFNEPIADAVRSILDGHINLSRKLASQNHYPALEITSSSSRVMHDIVTDDHWQLAGQFKELYALYLQNQDLIQIGAYQEGSNPKLDEAMRIYPLMLQYLKQNMNDKSDLESSVKALQSVLHGRPLASPEPIFEHDEQQFNQTA